MTGGADWRRIDLHLHTPGVASFACPGGAMSGEPAAQRELAGAYVDRLVAAGIEIAALTDYNGIRQPWYDLIRRAAADAGVLVLPGAELSLKVGKGLHVLAIFYAETDPREINESLRAVDRKPGRVLFDGRKHDEIDLREHLHQVLSGLRDRFGCLLVPAHVNSDKGLLTALGAKAAAECIRDVGVDGLEHAGRVREQLASTGVLTGEQLDTLALVEFSDPRELDDIGGKSLPDGTFRGTWLKLSAVDVDALRLALHDPQTRLSTKPPPVPTHPRLLRTEVRGSGFLGNLDVDWNPDLNALVGGRGTGKSALLEALRYALDLPVYSEADYRRDTVRRALGSGGEIVLHVERPGETGGKEYRVRRVLGQQPEVYDSSSGELLGVRPHEIFGPKAEPVVLLQQEIQAVSRDEAFRLKLIDILIGEEVAGAAREVAATIGEMQRNANQLADAQRRLAARAELEERQRSIAKEINFYESQGVAAKLADHTRVAEDDARRGAATALVTNEAIGAWRKELQALHVRIGDADNRLAPAGSAQAALLGDARSALRMLAAAVDAAEASLCAAFAAAGDAMAAVSSRWKEAVAPLQDELRRLEQELEDGKLEPDRLLLLVRQREELQPQQQAVLAAEQELNRLEAERENMLRKLGEQRLTENRLRRAIAEEVNFKLADKLHISVTYKGAKDDYQKQLGSVFRGSRVSGDVLAALAAPEATDGAALGVAAVAGAGTLAEQFGLTDAMAERVCTWLTGNGRLRELQVLAPNDSVSVELVVEGQGRPLDKLSMGQRATAILLLVFALEGRLLILDQPEDDLDNRFVFEDIVTLLREQKGLTPGADRRQVIAATHNPNIPVLGDAELVLALAAEHDRARVIARASIDSGDVRQHLRTVLEGGEEAFRRRAEKYGGVN